MVGRTICRLLDTENEVRRGQGDLDRDALMDVYLNIFFLYMDIYIYGYHIVRHDRQPKHLPEDGNSRCGLFLSV